MQDHQYENMPDADKEPKPDADNRTDRIEGADGDSTITVDADNASDVGQASEGLEEPDGSDTARDRTQMQIIAEKHRMSREAADKAGIEYVDEQATPVTDPVAAAMRRQNTEPGNDPDDGFHDGAVDDDPDGDALRSERND